MELFFDTETSGFIKKDLEFDHKDQAWCCQLAGILCDEGDIVDEINVIIKANGRTIDPRVVDIHGISAERADAEGVEEWEALEGFAKLLKDTPKRVCHNYSFDSAFLDHMFQRNMDKLSDEGRSVYFIQFPYFCTMKDAKIKKYVDARNVKGNLKFAKLEEMYKKLFNKDMENAHDAMVDAKVTMECYYELKRLEVI